MMNSEIPTLRQAWADYQDCRDLKPKTLRNYNYRISTYLGDWLDLPVTSITRKMIEERHRSIGAKAAANYSMKTLRSLLEFARAKYETAEGIPLLPSNPVDRLTQLKCWHRELPRQDVIGPGDFPALFKGLYQLDNHTARDLLLVILFTGMRLGEAQSLTWNRTNLQTGIITLRSTKNGLDAFIPMSVFVRKLLIQRRLIVDSPFVFPGYKRGGAFELDGDKATRFQASTRSFKVIREKVGIVFSPHTLRRTFASVADDVEVKHEVISALLNHYKKGVTEKYVIRSIERLRRASQAVADAILAYASGSVLPPIQTPLLAHERLEELRSKIGDVQLPTTARAPLRGGIPFGYDSYGGQVRRNEREYRIVVLIKDMRSQGLGYTDIARRLNEQGLRSRRGRWMDDTVKTVANRSDLLAGSFFEKSKLPEDSNYA